jgi:peroxiredoxin Q/BCP
MRLPVNVTSAVFALAAFALAAGVGLNAGEKGATVKVGDKAPSFTSVDENGKTWKSADHVGKKIVVVYFYPADFTGGCTAQACGFRDKGDDLKGKGIEIIGVSGDSAENHKKFKDDFKLPFTLLADEKGEIAKSFGVPVGKGGTATGKTSSGEAIQVTQGVRIQRYTVVIDKKGNVAALYNVKDAKGDAKKIAEIVEKLETK